MAQRDIVASFSGQIFEAAASKKWTSIISGPATVQIVNLDEHGHQIIALDKDCEVLVHDIDNEMQLRSKDNFVQWRKTNSAGKQVNYGLRLKGVNDSQHFEAIVGGVIAMLETIPSATPTKTSAANRAPAPGKPAPHKPPTTTTTTPAQAEKEQDMLLKVHLPGKQTTVISVPPNITMEELLSNIVTKRHLNPRYHELVLPPSKPKTVQTQFSPSTQLCTLGITEIHVVKRVKPLADKTQQAPSLPPNQRRSVPILPKGSVPPTEQNKTAIPRDQKIATQPSAQTQQKQAPMTILKVQLPYDQRTVVQVSPSMTMPQLLVYICEKRNLNPAHHTLVLPSPSSGQMRTVTREMTVSVITSGMITLIDLKAHQPKGPSSAMPEAKFPGRKGSFSPNQMKPVDKAQKKSAPPPPANEGNRKISQDLVHSLEKKVVDRSEDKEGKQTAPLHLTSAGDKETPSPKHIAKRKAPPPPKIKKEAIDETNFGPEASVSAGTPKQLTTSVKQPIPGSPAKRPAPGIPTVAAKQQVGQQPPPSPNKDQTTAKKRRPAPTRPPPQRKLESELKQETLMDTNASSKDVMDIKKTEQQGRPESTSSAQYKLEVDELEESLFNVVEEAERHLQEEVFEEGPDIKQESSVDSSHTPMETDSANKLKSDTSDTAKSKPEQDPSQVVSESGTIRGIKGRVREQIAASNQSQMMMHPFMKKQKSFTRTPLSFVCKSESDDQPIMNKRASLIRTGSQEDLSPQEPKQVFKRSNSQRVRTINQVENPEEKQLKPRGRAPPPPQAKQKQLQGAEEKKTTASTTIPSVNEATSEQTEQLPPGNVTAPTSQLDIGPVRERATTGGPETVRKVPPKVKPKTTRMKSKEAEDSAVVTSVTTKGMPVTSVQSHPPHPATLSKRAKSESHLKSIPKQLSPSKSSASIQSSNDGRQVLVLCPSPPPGGSKENQPTSAVRIFLPPPPPILPPCEEQEAEEFIKSPEKDNTVTSATQDQQLVDKVGTDKHVESQSSNTSHHTEKTSTGNTQDNTSQAIEPLPHVVFDPTEDLPPTPPGMPRNELAFGETKLPSNDKEIEAPVGNDEEIVAPTNDVDVETVPLPPPMDDFSIDEDSLPPPVDFDPSLLPPPLPGDDEFDEEFIVPPPPSADDIAPTLTDMVPSFEGIEIDTLAPDDVSPESTPPWTPPNNSEEPVEFEDDEDIPYSLPTEELLKDDVIEDTEDIENTENTTETVGDVEPTVESSEVSDTQDELSNIIASLQTMLEDQAESGGEEVDDSSIQTPPLSAWKKPPESPPKESLPDDSKNKLIHQEAVSTHSATVTQDIFTTQDAVTTVTKQERAITQNAVMTQEAVNTQEAVTSQDTVTKQETVVTQDAVTTHGTVTKPDTDQSNKVEIASVGAVKEETVTPKPVPTPVRAAPPPPPLPPIGKSISKLPTSPTKAKSPPPSVKPKPKRPASQPFVEDFQDELAAKLKKRQTKEQGWENTSQAAPTAGATQPQPKRIISRSSLPTVKPITPAPQSNICTAPLQPSQNRIPNAQPTVVPPVQGSVAMQNVIGAGNAQGSQEQVELQNQILILQMQQQLLLQQLQQGQAPNPMSLPQLGVPAGMQMPQMGMAMQMLQSGTGMQMPTGMQMSAGMQMPQLGTGMQLGVTSLPTQMMSASVSTPPIPGNVTSTPTSTSADLDTRSDSPPPLPLTSPPPLPTTSPPPLTDPHSSFDQLANKTMSKAVSDSVLHQRPTSQVLRSRAAGQYEEALDDILEEVREVDPSTILKKKPLPPPEKTGSPHTEMASLLAQAMKQRRINITSKRNSTSMDDEQDTSHEWD